MDLPPKLETLLRREDEDDAAFAERVDQHVARRAEDGWQLQSRQDNGSSVPLVFMHPPVR